MFRATRVWLLKKHVPIIITQHYWSGHRARRDHLHFCKHSFLNKSTLSLQTLSILVHLLEFTT